jgi:hypothetical protein
LEKTVGNYQRRLRVSKSTIDQSMRQILTKTKTLEHISKPHMML